MPSTPTPVTPVPAAASAPLPTVLPTALLIAVLLSLLAPLAWIEWRQINQAVMLALNPWLDGQPAGQPVALWLATLWSGLTVMGLGLSVFLVLGASARREPGWMAAFIYCLIIGGLLVHLVKHAIDAPRPAAVLSAQQLHVIGSLLRTRSMPSGHSASAFAWAAVVLLTPNRRRLRRWLIAPVLALATLVALSRIAVGAHWPLDVLVGSAMGWLFGGASVMLAGATGLTRWCSSRAGQWTLTVVWFGAGLAMCRQDTGYPLAEPLQWALGLACALGAVWRAVEMWREQRQARPAS